MAMAPLRASRVRFASVSLLACSALAVFSGRAMTAPAAAPAPAPSADAQSSERYRAPFYFEENRGQTDAEVRYMAQTPGGTVFLTDRESVLTLTASKRDGEGKTARTAVVRMRLAGARKSTQLHGEKALPSRLNYFVGNDPKQWQRNVPTFTKVRRPDAYPGVDVVYYGNERQLEYDFEVAPGADPSPIAVAFEGVSDARVAENGDLLMQTAAGQVRQVKPLVYQEADGARTEVESRYVVSERSDAGQSVKVAFELGEYDRSRTLVIDPLLVYSTFLGGTRQEVSGGIDVDGDGNAYVCGRTLSPEFPHVGEEAFVTSPDADNRKSRVFVSKFNPDGTQLIYSSVFGGKHIDASYLFGNHAWGMAVTAGTGDPNKDRCVWVGGFTTAPDFPTTPNALMPAHPEPDILRKSDGAGTQWREGFLTKLGPGGELVYSTYFGGLIGSKWLTPNGPVCEVMDVATFGGGAFITGYTTFYDNPNTDEIEGLPVQLGVNKNVFQPNYSENSTFGVGEDAFVAAFSDTGVMQYCTYLGGKETDIGNGIAVDVNGVAAVTGKTRSPNFPTTAGARQTGLAGEYDVFVTTVSQTGSTLFYSTYLGGSGRENHFGNLPYIHGDIAVDPDGDLHVTGSTRSADFPTTAGAYQPNRAGSTQNDEVFVAKIRTDAGLTPAQQLAFSTYLGGSGTDFGRSIAWRATPNGFAPTIAGSSQFSPDFPLVNPLFTGSEAFIAQFNAAGSELVFSTRLAPASTAYDGDEISLTHGPWGDIFATGNTVSTRWPTTVGAFQRTISGGSDAWVLRLRPSEFQVQITSCALTPETLPAAGGNTTITANVTSTIELDSVIARITGPAKQVRDVPLLLKGKTFSAVFHAPANKTAEDHVYHVVILAEDAAGTSANRNCGNVKVPAGVKKPLEITQSSVTPAELPSKGGRVKISATVAGTEKVKSVKATLTLPGAGVKTVRLIRKGGVYTGKYKAKRNRKDEPMVYGVVINAVGKEGTVATRDAGQFTVAAAED